MPEKKKEPRVISEEELALLVEAGERAHATLETLPRKIAKEYAAGFNRLIELIEEGNKQKTEREQAPKPQKWG